MNAHHTPCSLCGSVLTVEPIDDEYDALRCVGGCPVVYVPRRVTRVRESER